MFWICNHPVKFGDDRLRITKDIVISIFAGCRNLTAHAQKPKDKFRCEVFWICCHPVKFGDDRLQIAKDIVTSLFAGYRHLPAHAQKPKDKF